MKIKNVRLGFATNSSSSHSIVFFEGRTQEAGDHQSYGDFEFGWDMFELGSREAKLSYLAVAVKDTLRNEGLPDRMAEVILTDMFSGTGIERHIGNVMSGYIDHQSAFTIAHNSMHDLERNVRQYIDVFSDPRVVVYGGNDNSDDHYQGPDPKIDLGDEYSASHRVRKDGDAIVLFSMRTGAKVRLSSRPYEKSSVPELVDVKITDRCPYGCAFCYQGSTAKGKEPESYSFSRLFDALGQLGTFEVAIGGGEPTSHKGFAEIIGYALKAGLKPNFTTFAVDWLLDDEKVAAASQCGGIGVSVHAERDYGKVQKIAKRLPHVQIMAQHVFGTMPSDDTQKMLRQAKQDRIPVLLLGYKETGFGADFKPHDMKDFTKWFSKDSLPQLSVDTAFVERHGDIIQKLEINPTLISAKEGAFSMYVDGVTWRMGPSSYCQDAAMLPLPEKHNADLAAAIKDGFASF